jgi:hypothetical protein
MNFKIDFDRNEYMSAISGYFSFKIYVKKVNSLSLNPQNDNNVILPGK